MSASLLGLTGQGGTSDITRLLAQASSLLNAKAPAAAATIKLERPPVATPYVKPTPITPIERTYVEPTPDTIVQPTQPVKPHFQPSIVKKEPKREPVVVREEEPIQQSPVLERGRTAVKVVRKEHQPKTTISNKEWVKQHLHWQEDEIVTLNVGGRTYATTTAMLTNERSMGSRLAAIAKYKDSIPLLDGAIFIDRDPYLFNYVMNYIRTGIMGVPRNDDQQDMLALEIEFFGIHVKASDKKRSNKQRRNDRRIQQTWKPPENNYARASGPSMNNNGQVEESVSEDDNDLTLFVGGLPYSVVESDVTLFFNDLNVTGVRIIRDQGMSRGFGYVDFADEESVAAALDDYNGRQLLGRSVTVARETKRKNRGGSRSRSRGNSRSRRFNAGD